MKFYDRFLTEEQVELRALARKIALKHILPIRAECDRDSRFPEELLPVFSEAGLFGCYLGEEYQGADFGYTSLGIVIEEFARICPGIALIPGANALGTIPILLHGTPEQKAFYLPQSATGEALFAFGLTEPDAGSDAGSMKTTAVKTGNSWVLNGTKQFITNAGAAKYFVIFAVTAAGEKFPQISAFIVEKGTPGFKLGKKEDKLGIRASTTYELIFEDCKIPQENLLGGEGNGFKRVVMDTLNISRPGIAAQALGAAQGALDLAKIYIQQREQGGQTISKYQGIQWMIADMAMQIEAARSHLYLTNLAVDTGKVDPKMSAMTKVIASDMAMKVIADAVQLFGGYGYTKDYPIEKFYRDIKITQIYEGTNQIQRSIMARFVLKETPRDITLQA